jgi:hypothetical protein
MSWHFTGDLRPEGQRDADRNSRRERPGPAVPVPTLTEVIEPGDGVEVHPGPGAEAALLAAPPPSPAPTVLDAVLGRIQPEIERLFEQRLREALEPALTRAAGQLIGPLVASAVQTAVDAAVEQAVVQTRSELIRMLHERVGDAMAQEMHGSV